ncbi:MAG TPA: hypothetical protein VGI05_05130 [Streptosporangiaceae bacterium]|jgi:hypothetical protein
MQSTVASRLIRRRPVLDRGDEWAAHVGGSSGLHVAAADVTPRQTADLRASDRNWLAAQGIAWEPGETTQKPRQTRATQPVPITQASRTVMPLIASY